VIGFAMTAFLVVLSIRARADLGNDHVDGKLPVAKNTRQGASS
jgi:multicomponent K+:H+ antiporter subunit C